MSYGEGMVELTAADGFKLGAYPVRAEGTSKGGLVILQEIFGVTDQLRSVARAYAADGYDTIVPALFDRVERDCIVPFDDPDRGRALMGKVDPDKLLIDVDSARAYVDHGHGVSVLGFCWGGGQALRAAGALNLTSAVSYYGTKLANHLSNLPKCPMLFHFGDTDEFNYTPELLDQLKQAIPTAETYVYSAGHAFANDARKTFVPDAAAPARERSLAFLNKHHGA